MSPLISVVVPVYNTDRQLPRCIDSVLKQDYEDYELILVNDGSTDSTPDICERYAERSSHITVIHKENSGVADARNVGLRAAKGTYIYFMDSDDWIKENTLAELGEKAVESDPDLIVFGYTKKMMTDKNTHYVYSDLPRVELKSSEKIRNELCSLLDQGIRFSVWNKLFKRELIEKHSLSFPAMSRVDDMAFSMHYFRMSESLIVIPDRLYVHENYYNLEKFSHEIFQDHLELFEIFFDLYPGWMKKAGNIRFAARLFGFWFFYQIPKIMIGKYSKDRALKELRQMMDHESVKHYTSLFELQQPADLTLYFPILILNTGSSALLYYLNLVMSKFERSIKEYL